MFMHYCVEGWDIGDTVVMTRRYMERNWAVPRTEILDSFRQAESRSRNIINILRCLDNVCAKFRGRDDMETLKFFLCMYDLISGLVTECGMMVEYERTEMLLGVLPKQLLRKAISNHGRNPLEPCTFDCGKLYS
jgi:hypothetical protein